MEIDNDYVPPAAAAGDNDSQNLRRLTPEGILLDSGQTSGQRTRTTSTGPAPLAALPVTLTALGSALSDVKKKLHSKDFDQHVSLRVVHIALNFYMYSTFAYIFAYVSRLYHTQQNITDYTRFTHKHL